MSKTKKKKKLHKYVYRSAITSLLVTESFAKEHPKETVKEKIY